MDIQGNFFSPWEDDAQGYGENVRAFWLNIKNPVNVLDTKVVSKWARKNLQGSNVVVDSDGTVVNFYRKESRTDFQKQEIVVKIMMKIIVSYMQS